MAIHNLFKQSVTLDKEQHRYFHDDGREFLSFSRLYGFLSPKFDGDRIAAAIAKRDGLETHDVKGKWQGATDEGTRLDAAIKRYTETGKVADEDADISEIVKRVCEKYASYHSVYSDVVVFSERYRVAGEIDRISITGNRRDSAFHISDFKRFEKGVSFLPKGQRWLNYPFAHHANSKYNRISWQMSFYAVLFSELTGRKCERLFIDVVQPVIKENKVVDFMNYEVPVNFLKADVEYFLNHFEGRILEELNPKTIEITDEF